MLFSGEYPTLADSTTVNGFKVPTQITENVTIPAAAQAVSQVVLIADQAYQLAGVQAIWGTASSSGTVTVEKLTGTTAPGSGTALLTGTISTAGTANTVNNGTLISTLASLQLAKGDRLGLVFSGTETGLVGLCVQLSLVRV